MSVKEKREEKNGGKNKNQVGRKLNLPSGRVHAQSCPHGVTATIFLKKILRKI